MKLSNKQLDKIADHAAGQYLSEGTYKDLEKAVKGNKKAKANILVWEVFEDSNLDTIFEMVNNSKDSIIDLISNL